MAILVPQAGLTHDVVFQLGAGGTRRGFMHLAQRYAEVRVNDFAPSFRIGNAPQYAEGTFSTLAISDFTHGVDNNLLDEGDQGAYWSDGNVFLHRDDYISLQSSWASADASAGNATFWEILDFLDLKASAFNWLVMAAGTKIRKSADGATWSDENDNGTPLGANIIWMVVFDQQLYMALTGANWVRWNGTAGSGMTNPASTAAFNAVAFTVFRESLVAAVEDDLKISATGDAADWSDLKTGIGDPGTNIHSLWSAEDYIIIGKPEGLYVYDSKAASGDEITQIWVKAPLSTENFRFGGIWRGASFSNVLRQIFKINISGGVNFTDNTPNMKGTDERELYGHGMPIGAVSAPFNLLVGFEEGEGTGATENYAEVLGYNGLGWHQEFRSDANEGPLNALGYSRLTGHVYINYNGATHRRALIDRSEVPTAPYAASGIVISPWIDGGLPNMPKAFRDITLNTRDCDTDNTVLVEYEIDDSGSWVIVGTIQSTPREKLTLKGINGPVVAKRLRFRFTLTRDSGDTTKTPRIKLPPVFELSVLPLPPPLYARTYALKLGSDVELRLGWGKESDWDSPFTISQQLNFLEGMQRNADDLIETDEFGRRHRVRMTDRSRALPVRRSDDTEESVTVITVLDTFAGPTGMVVEGVTATEAVSGTLYAGRVSDPLYYDESWGWGRVTYRN